MSLKSVHLESFPSYSSIPSYPDVLSEMQAIRAICNSSLSIRNKLSVKVRIPISTLTVYSKEDLNLSDYKPIIADEVNVKNIIFSNDFDSVSNEYIILNLPKCGEKFGKDTGKIMSMVNQRKYSKNKDGSVNVDNFTLDEELFEVMLEPKIKEKDKEYAKFDLSINGIRSHALIEMDMNITDELIEEGLLRDLVRSVQESRKSADFYVSDVVNVAVFFENPDIYKIFQKDSFISYTANQTLTKHR